MRLLLRTLSLALLLSAVFGGCKRESPPPAPGPKASPETKAKAAHEVAALSYLPTVPALTADGEKVGVTLHAKEAYDGLFLNCSTRRPSGLSIHAASGALVHAISFPEEKWYFGCHDVQPHPSGDFLVITDWAVMRIAWDGTVRWKRESWKQPTYEVHHELFMDGPRLFALAHKFAKHTPNKGEPVTYFHDLLIELNPDTGETMGEVFDIHAFVENRITGRHYAQENKLVPRWKRARDPLHTNAATLIERDSPPFKKGDLIISFFYLHELLGVRGWQGDKPEEIWRYAPTEFLISPHGPRLMDNGHILYFENGEATKRTRSSVRELDPVTKTIMWEWNKGGELHSAFCGYVQDLPGERFLVSETTSARMTEIDRRGRPLWEFLFALENKGNTERARSCRGYKVVDPARWGAPMVALDRQVRR